MSNTYTATAPNGEKITRRSKRAYTHAVLTTLLDAPERGWLYCGFCGSKELAEKLFNAPRTSDEGQRVIVELEVAK